MASTPNLVEMRQRLAELVRRKAEVADSLVSLERQIFMFEGSYLEDPSSSFGNAVRGWDRQMALPSSSSLRMECNVGRKRFRQTERIFSNSSATAESAMNEEFGGEKSSSMRKEEQQQHETVESDSQLGSRHMQKVAKASQMAAGEQREKKRGRKKRRRDVKHS